ncbi:tetratricopeptide repeat protein [Paraburkholderia sp.]|uniref:tetratricopeptide repeat protein n=1 Tax=Paraburkholderia sp. TaxID=1926495 RepID=UPI003D6FF114
MALLRHLIGILGLKSRSASAPAPRPVADATTAKTIRKSPVDAVHKPIRLPSKFDDLVDFGLAQHSPNKHWSVGYWDPGPDASQKRRRTVRLRDNTTGRIVATVNNLERPFSVDVSDAGVFGVNDAGQASELSSNLVIFDTTGKPMYGRIYKANLFGFSISPCGRYVASQTCNSANEDSSVLEIHDVVQQRVLASCTPVAGWSSAYTFETEDGKLKRVFATINHLGKFAYSPTGEFLDAKKFMTTRLTKGDPWTRIRAAGELVQTDGSDKVLERAFGVVAATISAFQLGQDDRWLAGGYRLKGELLEKVQRLDEAMEAYRAALAINPKIGVKKKLADLEKAVSHQTLLEAGAGRRANS